MADQTPLDLDALEAALAAAAAKPWRVSDGGIDAIVSLRNTALALIARLRAAEREAARLLDEMQRPRCCDCGEVLGENWCAVCSGKIDREALAAAREAHAKALAHALRRLDDDEFNRHAHYDRGYALDCGDANNLLAARLAAAKETTT